MSKRRYLIIILPILLLALNLSASNISYNLARDVAYHKAVSVFGNGISLGSGIPYYDIEDKLMGYEFGISLQGEFPEVSHILAMVQDKRAILDDIKTNGGFLDLVEIEKELAGIGEFGHIFVSTNSSDFPVPEYGTGLPDYYQKFDEAKEYAWDYFGAEPSLVRMYYLTPYLKWYKFSANGEEIFVRLHGSQCKKPDDISSIRLEKCPDADVLEKRHVQLWERIKKGDFSVLNGSRAGYIDSVPEYVWSYGCSPTASAMVMGYWDESGYDRLVDWYWNHFDPCESQVVMNMPNVQKELAIAMYTDTIPGSGCGGTYLNNIAAGHIIVANNYNGYSFSASKSPEGYVGNDFVWNWITSEIDGGRPFNWSLNYYWFQGEFIDHSTTAYGYTDDKYVILFNTWGWGEQYWYYYTYHNYVYSKDWVITAVPSGAITDKVTLTIPDGGEQWYAGTTDTIKWTTEGNNINHLGIWFSSNGGKDWQNLTTNTPNTGSYAWFIQPDSLSTYRAKVRLEGYNSSNTLLGADGSAHDFTIYPQTGCTLYVTAPNGGEIWSVGEVHQITWEAFGVQPHHVIISYSPDGGYQWDYIITYPNTGSYSWTIPDDTTHSALVKVRGLTQQNGLLGEDVSDSFFTIAATGIEEGPTYKVKKPFSVSVSPVPMSTSLNFAIQGGSSSNISLYIMDVSGRIVRHIEGKVSSITWDGRDNKGREVKSGIYIYKIIAGRDKVIGKVSKIR